MAYTAIGSMAKYVSVPILLSICCDTQEYASTHCCELAYLRLRVVLSVYAWYFTYCYEWCTITLQLLCVIT